ncbi:hypothetical protein BDK51DRAFT_30609 [Blyttiomyces helicus]|uniref:Uncharacterized protein n=1 Tax=Blyttiomyces helicus TaxID=388810 RepID=A0A4P9WHW8_9FUNG|nr:hypothetical protein BDK51DRAFT_30609 [Blyttiomyces helicus]|eukprot:RKO91992.1 hypothetical protein BDK51DRAFT_30609 [Blyttiomyces helicus]
MSHSVAVRGYWRERMTPYHPRWADHMGITGFEELDKELDPVFAGKDMDQAASSGDYPYGEVAALWAMELVEWFEHRDIATNLVRQKYMDIFEIGAGGNRPGVVMTKKGILAACEEVVPQVVEPERCQERVLGDLLPDLHLARKVLRHKHLLGWFLCDPLPVLHPYRFVQWRRATDSRGDGEVEIFEVRRPPPFAIGHSADRNEVNGGNLAVAQQRRLLLGFLICWGFQEPGNWGEDPGERRKKEWERSRSQEELPNTGKHQESLSMSNPTHDNTPETPDGETTETETREAGEMVGGREEENNLEPSTDRVRETDRHRGAALSPWHSAT